MPTAWRAWMVTNDGGLTRAFPKAEGHVWHAGWNRPRCYYGAHPAPAAGCICGFHVVTSEAALWAFIDRRTRERWLSAAVGLVEYEGEVMGSAFHADPPGTLRVGRARVVGPVVVMPKAELVAPAIRERYGVQVVSRELHELRRVLHGPPPRESAPASVTAWRGWRLSDDGRLRAPARHVTAPWDGGEHAARCSWRPAHHPPVADCGCGVHAVGELSELLEYTDPAQRPWLDELHVIGQVELSGRILKGTATGDPPSTMRAERGRVTGRVYVARPLWGRIPAFERLHPSTTVHRVESLRDVTGAARGAGTVDAVVFDVDGTLRDVRDVLRRGLDREQRRLALTTCPPNASMISTARAAQRAGLKLLVVTYRPRRYAGSTARWLAENVPVPFAGLYMRTDDDRRPAAVVKRELIGLIRDDGYRITHAYDDEPAVVDAWRAEGVAVTQVVGFGGHSVPDDPEPADQSLARRRAAELEELHRALGIAPATPPPASVSTDAWATCALGHRHWGKAGAAGLLIVRDTTAGPELLLQRRAPWTHHGGTWGIPGGALRVGESPEAGAVRETCEELGLRPGDVVLGGSVVDDHGGWTYTTVLAEPTRRLEPADVRLNSEGTAVAWWPVANLPELHPGLAGTLPRLLAVLHRALYGPEGHVSAPPHPVNKRVT